MCSETGSRYTGLLLVALAIAAIIANLLLYFPSGQVLEPAKITDLVWFFHGFLGAGLLVMVPALIMLRGGGEDCCAHRCGMLFPVLLAVQGTVGAVYCVVISSLGLLSGPLCDTGSGNYTYPFRNYSLENSYLLNQPTWANCQEPEHIVLWNVVLFSILLGIGVVEAVLCLSQVISGLCDIFCGTCVRKGQLILRSKKRYNVILQMRNSGSERFSYLSEVSKSKF
ncbi:transmembrane 4 L6 family member 1-like [Delphinapterus leucas]|uniref:Transmembrane 4 L6 family member 1-like n=1 Tax=Delphinapterus leucas TaxID=9749 RepID=A0A2Y9MDE8_DELLE|nr:transmembrane 4 L6 family member 1-like [Delphinapterus leucas]